MTFSIGQKITFSAEPGEVLSVEAGKRGSTLLTIRLQSGRTLKVDSRSVEALPEFAAPISAAEFFAPLPSSAAALRAKINR